MIRIRFFAAILTSCGILASSISIATPIDRETTVYKHEVSKDVLIEHKALPREKWLNSKQRLELFKHEERISTSPSSISEKALVLWANTQASLATLAGTLVSYLALKGLVSEAAAGGFGAMLLMGQTNEMVAAFKKGVNFKLEHVDALKLLKAKLFENSEELVGFLPAGLRDVVAMVDRDIVAALNGNGVGVATKLFLARERVLLAMPLHAHPIDSKSTPEVEAKFKRVIDRTLPENRATLQGLIHAMEDNSRLHSQRELSDGTPAAGTKTVVFLNGPRGTGKTEFVRDLAAASGLKDACVIKLAELENATDLIGTGYYENDGPTDKTMGKILKCILDAGVVNPIIFFEEASNSIGAEPRRSLLNQSSSEMNAGWKKMAFLEILKTLFEKDTTSAAFKFAGLLNAPYDISRVTFILAGNFPLHKDLSSGGRVTNVYFGPLSPEQKQNAAQEELNAQLARLNDKPSQHELVRSIFTDRLIQFVIAKDENRFIPGARILKSVVQKTITHILHTGSANENEIKHHIGYTFAAEDKRDAMERKNDALAIAVSRQERMLRTSNIEFAGRTLSNVEISRIIETLREAQEHILIAASESLPEPQAIAAGIKRLCDYITMAVVSRDLKKYSDDEIETFAIPERDFLSFVNSLFSEPQGAAIEAAAKS
jgi:hypothetical protein